MKSTVILDPHPRTIELIFPKERLKLLKSLCRLYSHDGERMPAAMVEKHLPEASVLIGQTDLPRGRLEQAGKLRAVINVEGNFQQNIDYDYCFEHGIHVLNAGVAYAPAVAEMVMGFAIALARGIAGADRSFREGKELYGRISNSEAFLLHGKRVGLVGFGNLGRALLPLLKAFGCSIVAYDPWLPENLLRSQGLEPVSLSELLRTSKIVILLAGATSENTAMLGHEELNLIQKGAAFILASRASLVDFDALTEILKSGRFSAAIDVFPEEPFPRNHPLRSLPNVLLSAHRAGGLPDTYALMGEIVLDDLSLILKGLPPLRLQRADRETVGLLQSKPVKWRGRR